MQDWKYIAREKLKDYAAQEAALTNITSEIARLKSESESIRSAMSDTTPVKGGGNTREDMLLSNISRRTELAAMRRRAKLAVQTADRALAVLSEEERRLLDLMYIHPSRGNVERLRQELGLEDDRGVYRRCEKALRHFTIALYGGTEN